MWSLLLNRRLLSLRRMVNSRTLASKPSHAKFGGIRCDAHMNELPVPCGSWDKYYKDRQSFYNKVLGFGALWWIISLSLMIYTGSFYLNWAEPLTPSPAEYVSGGQCEQENL